MIGRQTRKGAMTRSKKTDSEDGQLLPHPPDWTRDQSQKQRLGSRAHVASRHTSPNAALHNSCEQTILSLFQLTHPKLGEEDPSKTLKTQPRKRDWIFRLPSQLSDLQRRGCFCVVALSTTPPHLFLFLTPHKSHSSPADSACCV